MNEKIVLINIILETIGLSTEQLEGEQRAITEYVFTFTLQTPQLHIMSTREIDKYIQNMFDHSLLYEKGKDVWDFNHFYIKQKYNEIRKELKNGKKGIKIIKNGGI